MDFFPFLHEILHPKNYLIAQQVEASKFTSFKVMIPHLINHSGIHLKSLECFRLPVLPLQSVKPLNSFESTIFK